MSWRDRMKSLSIPQAAKFVDKHGLLLVYPVNNRPLPLSLWSCFYPRSKMRWVWDENGDDRIVVMWDLREKLSLSERVVYAKWYQNRATFISRELFPALLHGLNASHPETPDLPKQAQALYQWLLEDSPQTTKELKKRARSELGWESKEFDKSLKTLWQRLLVVGVGEVDDGAFPSLNIAATENIFEDLFRESCSITKEKADLLIEAYLPKGSLWRKFYESSKATKSAGPKKRQVIRYSDLISR